MQADLRASRTATCCARAPSLVPRTVYVARAFLRYTIPLASADSDRLDAAMDQAAMTVPKRRVEIMAGKFALNDMFDLNSYAGSTRLQFENWALWENTAWDFAADTRGYTNGVALSWFEPSWILRVASAQMPTFANGNSFDGRVLVARGDQAELTLMPGDHGTIVRLLAYDNHGRMGDYAEALAIARQSGKTPDIVADDKPGRVKYGFGAERRAAARGFRRHGRVRAARMVRRRDRKFRVHRSRPAPERRRAGRRRALGRHDDRLGVAFFAHGLSTCTASISPPAASAFCSATASSTMAVSAAWRHTTGCNSAGGSRSVPTSSTSESRLQSRPRPGDHRWIPFQRPLLSHHVMYWISKLIHKLSRLKRRWLILLAVIGPGIITMVADNDAGGISTYAQTGAKTGFSLLWVFIILVPMAYYVQEMTVRLGAVTKRGHAEAIFDGFGPSGAGSPSSTWP